MCEGKYLCFIKPSKSGVSIIYASDPSVRNSCPNTMIIGELVSINFHRQPPSRPIKVVQLLQCYPSNYFNKVSIDSIYWSSVIVVFFDGWTQIEHELLPSRPLAGKLPERHTLALAWRNTSVICLLEYCHNLIMKWPSTLEMDLIPEEEHCLQCFKRDKIR